MHLTVGGDELIDRIEQGVAPLLIEGREELEAAELELRVDHGVAIVVRRDRLGHHVGHEPIDVLEDLVEVAREAIDDVLLRGRISSLHRAIDALLDEARDGGLHDVALRRIEVAIDVAEGRHREDERLHLALGHLGVPGQVDHGRDDTRIRECDRALPPWPPSAVRGREVQAAGAPCPRRAARNE